MQSNLVQKVSLLYKQEAVPGRWNVYNAHHGRWNITVTGTSQLDVRCTALSLDNDDGPFSLGGGNGKEKLVLNILLTVNTSPVMHLYAWYCLIGL